MKQKPTGFIATCQCGVIVGALDYDRTDRKDAGQILGKWLADGCTVEPRFTGSWRETIKSCKCAELAESDAAGVIQKRINMKCKDIFLNGTYRNACGEHRQITAITKSRVAFIVIQERTRGGGGKVVKVGTTGEIAKDSFAHWAFAAV